MKKFIARLLCALLSLQGYPLLALQETGVRAVPNAHALGLVEDWVRSASHESSTWADSLRETASEWVKSLEETASVAAYVADGAQGDGSASGVSSSSQEGSEKPRLQAVGDTEKELTSQAPSFPEWSPPLRLVEGKARVEKATVIDLSAKSSAIAPASTPRQVIPKAGVAPEIAALELLGSQGSAREGEALAQALDGEHLTAVGFLTRAAREGQTLTRVDATNVDAALAAAELSSDAELSVRAGVERGLIAWISETQLPFETWDTTGYVLEDAATGAGGYFVTFERLVQGLEANIVFHSPQDLDEVTAPIDVVATLEGEEIASWTLAYLAADGGAAVELASGTGTFSNATLAQFDPTLLLNGLYDIVLTARDAAGQSASQKISVSVEGQMKIGHFTLSLLDLRIPASGLEIEILRHYDSRDKVPGDFGVGWRLGLRQGSYRNNRPPGEGWQITEGFLPCDRSAELQTHQTTIRLSDREIYEFRPRLVNLAPTFGGCFGRTVFEFVDGPFNGASLEVLTNDEVFWTNGTDRLIDIDTFEVFEPDAVRLTTRDGRVFDLNLQGGVTRLADPNGNAISISSEGITHTTGRSAAFERDAQGRITRITDPLGHSMVYEYDANGDLVRVLDFEEHETRFTYDDDHRVVDIIDDRGVRAMRAEYDSGGRLIEMIDAFGNAVGLQHDLSARREILTNRLGLTRVMEYDERGNVTRESDELGKVTLRSHDSRDRLLSETDPLGNTTTYTYDVDGNLTTIEDSLGSTFRFSYVGGNPTTITDPRNASVSFTYDSQGNLLTATNAVGAVTSFTYDEAGNVQTSSDSTGAVNAFDYDDLGNLIRQVDPAGNETTFTHDANGQVLTQITSRTTSAGLETLVTSFVYDRLGQVTATTWPDGSATRMSYDYLGAVTQSIDAAGRMTTFDYDLGGRLTRTIYPDGAADQRIYDAEGRVTSLRDRGGRAIALTRDAVGRVVSTRFPDETVNQATYDAAGHPISLTDGRGAVIQMSYDPAGRLLSVTDPLGRVTAFGYDAAGNTTEITDPQGNVTRLEYDLVARPTKWTFADGSERRMEYDAMDQPTAAVDPEGARTEFNYDALGRLIGVTDALGGRTVYGYDEVGNRVSVTDALRRVTRFEHDALGRQVRKIFPDGAFESFAYDVAGNLVQHTDLDGGITTLVYDAGDRLIEQIHSDGPSTRYTYTPTGQRATATDARGTAQYTYDERDRLVSFVDPSGHELRHSYDPASNRLSTVADLGAAGIFTTTYTYDLAGQLIAIDSPAGTFTQEFDATGNRLRLGYPNGVDTIYSYDSLNRLTGLSTSTAAGEAIQSYQYTLGVAGQRLAVDENDGTRRDYSHDALYRLLSETVTADVGGLVYSNSFSYDAVGNRLEQVRMAPDGSRETLLYSYDMCDRLVSAAGSPLTWNSDGTLAQTAGIQYGWDTEVRLISANLPDGSSAAYIYDADGMLVDESQTSTTGQVDGRDLLVDSVGPISFGAPLGQVVAETDDGGQLESYYVRAGDSLLAAHRPSGDRYFHAEGLSSIRALTDAAAEVTDRYRYEAFGQLLEHQGVDPSPYGFAGERRDPLTHLSYLRARWLDPSTGRFTQIDPNPGLTLAPWTLHRYLYVGGEPVGRIDPTGLFGMADVNATLATISNLSQMAVRLFQAIDKARAFIDTINTVIGFLQILQGGNFRDYILDSLTTALTDNRFSVGDIVESLSRNLPSILSRAFPRWSAWLLLHGRNVKGLSLYLPNPGIKGQIRIPTGLRVGRFKVTLVAGGKSKRWSLIGVGFLAPGIKGATDLQQMWRMDYHAPHFFGGQSLTDPKDPKDIAVWLDSPFHYHVLKPGQ